MHDDEQSPLAALSVGFAIAGLGALILDLAKDELAALFKYIGPVMTPPRGLRVVAPGGTQYTGVVVIDHNEIVLGVVVPVAASTTAVADVAHHHDRDGWYGEASVFNELPPWQAR